MTVIDFRKRCELTFQPRDRRRRGIRPFSIIIYGRSAWDMGWAGSGQPIISKLEDRYPEHRVERRIKNLGA